MSYVSIGYYLMIVLTVIIYYVWPRKTRWFVLLLASCYFYCSAIVNIMQMVLFVSTIAISFFVALIIQRLKNNDCSILKIKIVLVFGIVISISPLIASKCGEFSSGFIFRESQISWIFPIGMSFYSMQVIAYLVDVYRDKIEPQKNILKYGLFISFFPIIVQGPISRYDQLGNQLFEGHDYNHKQIMSGIQLIIWGFFLKYLIADKASIYVTAIFDNYTTYTGLYIFIAAILYSIQLYTDFLSCVTISQGVSELFGIRLIDNFHNPYFSDSIKEFWRRWHISLSSWLRDYVYIPLGGNKKGKFRKYINLIITFTVSGIWHGGRWQYLFWGLMHAGYQIAGEILKKPKDAILEHGSLHENSKMRSFIETICTSFLVMIAWIIFRAESLKAGIKMIISMLTTFNPWILFDNSLFRMGLNQKEFEVLFLAILVLIAVSVLHEKGIKIREWFSKQNILIRWTIYLCAIWSIWIFGTYGYGFNSADFIYGGF